MNRSAFLHEVNRIWVINSWSISQCVAPYVNSFLDADEAISNISGWNMTWRSDLLLRGSRLISKYFKVFNVGQLRRTRAKQKAQQSVFSTWYADRKLICPTLLKARNQRRTHCLLVQSWKRRSKSFAREAGTWQSWHVDSMVERRRKCRHSW